SEVFRFVDGNVGRASSNRDLALNLQRIHVQNADSVTGLIRDQGCFPRGVDRHASREVADGSLAHNEQVPGRRADDEVYWAGTAAPRRTGLYDQLKSCRLGQLRSGNNSLQFLRTNE